MSGITDEAAIESHDLIHNAEIEEQKAHGDHALTQPEAGDSLASSTSTATSTAANAGNSAKKEGHSTMDKVKEALHIKK